MFRFILITFLIGMLVSASGDTQHFNNYLRSTSATEMLLPELPEEDSPKPQRSDINGKVLKRKLGKDFEPQLMSAVLPSKSSQSENDKKKWRLSQTSLLKLVKRLQKKPRKKQKKLISLWFKQTTSCPVQYSWFDLGSRYWPRYVKKGYCETKKSCSVPEGMMCQPSASRNITVMRFHCQGITTENQYCVWIKAKIPIIANCKCKCDAFTA